MSYLITIIITSIKFFEEPEKEQINPWPKHNLIRLNKIIIKI